MVIIRQNEDQKRYLLKNNFYSIVEFILFRSNLNTNEKKSFISDQVQIAFGASQLAIAALLYSKVDKFPFATVKNRSVYNNN